MIHPIHSFLPSRVFVIQSSPIVSISETMAAIFRGLARITVQNIILGGQDGTWPRLCVSRRLLSCQTAWASMQRSARPRACVCVCVLLKSSSNIHAN